MLPEVNAINIQTYYNGRLAMLNAILADLDNVKDPTTLHYDIPEKYNSFDVEDNDDSKLSKQLEAYIEIVIVN